MAPDTFKIRYQLADLQIKAGHPGEAEAHLRWCLARRPDLTRLRVALADTRRRAASAPRTDVTGTAPNTPCCSTHAIRRSTPPVTNRTKLAASVGAILALSAISYAVAYALRFGGVVPRSFQHQLLWSLPMVVLAKTTAMWLCRVHASFSRYVGFEEPRQPRQGDHHRIAVYYAPRRARISRHRDPPRRALYRLGNDACSDRLVPFGAAAARGFLSRRRVSKETVRALIRRRQ